MEAGLVEGEELYFDATRVEADASMDSLRPRLSLAATQEHVRMVFEACPAVVGSYLLVSRRTSRDIVGNNRDVQATWHYHEGTKHSFQSVHSSQHFLDFENQPLPFKIYSGLEPIPLPPRGPAGHRTPDPGLRGRALPCRRRPGTASHRVGSVYAW